MELDATLMPCALRDVPQVARAAEEAGFDALWIPETSHDPFLAIALAAEHTKEIKLGTAVAVAFPRSPMTFAMTAWDLQQLSGGRFILGLGTQVKGHNERRFGIRWEAPGPKLREMILTIRAIWDCWQNGAKPDYVGKYYQFTLMTPFFSPGPIEHPDIPIYIAGVNEYMCRLAGELCQGFHIHPFHSVKYLREFALAEIEAGAAKAGRKLSDVTLTTSAFVITGADQDEMERSKAAVRSQLSFYASTRTYRKVLELHGWGEVADLLNEKAAAGDWSGMADLITDDMLEVYAVTGRPDEIGPKLREKYNGILNRINLYLPFHPGSDLAFWRELKAALAG